MIVLEKFKNIAEDDKKNLPIYCIYNDIYNSAKSNNFDISDADAMTIQEKSYDLYINDDYGHMPASKIAYFLTDCYSKDDLFLNKIEDYEDYQILQAVEDYDLNFYKEDKLEL